MIKKIFIKNCHSSNNLINDFKSANLVLLSYCVLSRNTVTERDLIRLNKSTDKKKSDLLTGNFHCSSDNKHMKNTQKCIYVLKRANLNSIL